MSVEPRKVGRRSFIYAGLGAVALIAIGAAAYFATRPPAVVTQTTTVPTTTVVTQPTTTVVTTTIPTITTVTQPTTTITTVTTTVARPKGEITVPLHKPPWLAGFQAVISQYEKVNESAKVSLSSVANITELRDKQVADAINKTGLYDLYMLNQGMGASILVLGGHTRKISELDPNYKKDPNLTYFGWIYRDNELTALPLNVNNDLLFYRGDLFKERGLKKPETWEDVINAAKTLHDPSKPVYGFIPRVADDPCYEWWHMLVSFGGNVFVDAEKGDFTIRVNDEHGLAATETFAELLKYAPPEPMSITQSDVMAYMSSGKGAQALTVYANSPWMDDPTYSLVPMKIEYAIPPKGFGLPGCDYGPIDFGCFALGVSSYAKNIELAYDFANFCSSYDAQLTLAMMGVGPVRKDVASLPSLIANPKYRALKEEGEALKYMKSLPHLPEMTYIHNPIGKTFIQKIVSGANPKDALNWFAEEIYKYMKEKGYKTSWTPLK